MLPKNYGGSSSVLCAHRSSTCRQTRGNALIQVKERKWKTKQKTSVVESDVKTIAVGTSGSQVHVPFATQAPFLQSLNPLWSSPRCPRRHLLPLPRHRCSRGRMSQRRRWWRFFQRPGRTSRRNWGYHEGPNEEDIRS